MASNNNEGFQFMKDGKILGIISTGELVKVLLGIEIIAIAYTALIAMGKEAPKWCTIAGVASAVPVLKAGSTDTYLVLNADLTKLRTTALMDADLTANQLTNLVIIPQKALIYPIVQALFPFEDRKLEIFA